MVDGKYSSKVFLVKFFQVEIQVDGVDLIWIYFFTFLDFFNVKSRVKTRAIFCILYKGEERGISVVLEKVLLQYSQLDYIKKNIRLQSLYYLSM